MSRPIPSASCSFRWALIMCLCVSWSGLIPAQLARAQAKAATDKDLQVARSILEAARTLLRKPDANPSDARAMASQLGAKPVDLIQFVREKIAFEPYFGSLRGAAGTLVSRCGNSLDKAQLLQEMLTASGMRCRIMRGSLPADRATALVDEYLKTGGQASAWSAPADESTLALARTAGLDEATVKQYIEKSQKEYDTMLSSARQRTTTAVGVLSGAIKPAGVTLGQSLEDWKKQLVARVSDHFWLQMSPDGSKWEDVDPTFPANAPILQNGRHVTDLEPLRHTVTLNLNYVTDAGGGKEKLEQIMTATMPADTSLKNNPEFNIHPADDLPGVAELYSMPSEEAIKLLAKIKKFQGVLRYGSVTTPSRVFDLEGNLYDVSSDGRVKGASQVGGQVRDMFGGLTGSEGPAEKANRFVRLEATITFNTPGAPAVTQSRLLLSKADTIGEHTISPMLSWEVIIQAQPITAAMANFQVLSYTVANFTPVVELMDAMAKLSANDKVTPELKSKANAVGTSQPAPVSPFLIAMALVRQDEIAASAAQNKQLAVLWDKPVMVISERRMCLNKVSGHSCHRPSVDIVSNSNCMVPRDSASSSAAAEATFRQGVFDTLYEALALENSAPGDRRPDNAVILLEEMQSKGGKLSAISVKDAASAATTLSETDRKWIAGNENAGQIIVSPSGVASDTTPSVWWSLDPKTGSILGRMNGGRGAALTEKAVKEVALVVKYLLCFGLDSFYPFLGGKTGVGGFGTRIMLCIGAAAGGYIALGYKAGGFLAAMLVLEVVQKFVNKFI